MPPIHLINVTPDEAAWKEAAKKWHRTFLKMPVLAMADTTRFMTGLPGCRTNQYLGTVQSEAQFYPYVANKRGDGSTSIKFEELGIFFGSMIHDFVPNDYVQTLLGEHADVLGMGQAKTEMAKLIISTIMESAGEKLALAIPVAERNANGNTTLELFNGLVTLIEDAMTAGKVSVAKKNLTILNQNITANNVVDVIKKIEFSLDPRLRRQERFLYCDPAIVDVYNEGYLLTHPAVPYNEKYEQNFVEGSNRRMTFAPLDGLAGTGYMFVAPKNNVVYGYDGVSDEERFEILRLDADTMTINAKMFFGVGFRTFDFRFLHVVEYNNVQADPGDDGEEVSPAEDTPSVTPTSMSLDVNDTRQLTLSPANGWTFVSANEEVATVSDAGLVTAVAVGQTTITATNGTTEIEIAVSVVDDEHAG